MTQKCGVGEKNKKKKQSTWVQYKQQIVYCFYEEIRIVSIVKLLC